MVEAAANNVLQLQNGSPRYNLIAVRGEVKFCVNLTRAKGIRFFSSTYGATDQPFAKRNLLMYTGYVGG